MNAQMNSIVDVILDRSPEELIGGVLMALMLALGLSGLFLLLRRKVSDVSTLIVCLALGSNLVAMTVAGAYVRYGLTGGRRASEPGRVPSFGRFSHYGGYRSSFLASRILEFADRDADKILTVDEAASAAAQFVEEIDEQGEGRLDEQQLRAAIRSRLWGMSHGPGGPPVPVDPAMGTEYERDHRRREDRERAPIQDPVGEAERSREPGSSTDSASLAAPD